MSDVRIALIEPSQGHDFSIEFESPSRFARLEGVAAPIRPWVAKTREVAPAGGESFSWESTGFLTRHPPASN